MTKQVFSLAAFGIATLWVSSCAADGALAIGVPARGPSGGFVYGYQVDRSLDEAKNAAVDLCRGITVVANSKPPDSPSEAQKSCKLVSTFRDQCGAAAHNGTKQTAATGIGWAIASDRAAAVSQAIAECESMAGGRGQRACTAEDSFCDGAAK